MLCWICGEVEVEEIILDSRDGKIRHCHVCEEIIQDCLRGLESAEDEVASVEEDFDKPMAYQQGFGTFSR